MNTKFTKPFMELKLYLPLDSGSWHDFKNSEAYQLLDQLGLISTRRTPKQQKEGQRHGK